MNSTLKTNDMKRLIIALTIDENKGEEYTFEEYSGIISEAIRRETTATVKRCTRLKTVKIFDKGMFNDKE